MHVCETLRVSADSFWGLSATAWTGIYTLLTAGLLAVAVVAALYAKRKWNSTRQQLMETRQAELEARRPYVIVTIEPSETSRHLFDLVVRNIGQRPAESVSIVIGQILGGVESLMRRLSLGRGILGGERSGA